MAKNNKAAAKTKTAKENTSKAPAKAAEMKVVSDDAKPEEVKELETEDPQAPAAVKVYTIDEAIAALSDDGYQIVKVGETATLEDQLVIVIPYKKSSAAGEELKYTLRAWEKQLPGCKVVVIGDAEDWFSSDVLHIDAPHASENPQIDVAIKMMIAIASDEVPDNFIWSNDDIVPVSPVDLADIQLLKCNGNLVISKPGQRGIYAENKQRTIEALSMNNLPTFDYSTHTPYFFNKEKLAEVIDTLRADEEGYLVSSLYFNRHFKDIVPVKITGGRDCFFYGLVYREDPPMDIVKEVFNTRKYVNYNDRGYKAIQGILESKYPEKSRFEV